MPACFPNVHNTTHCSNVLQPHSCLVTNTTQYSWRVLAFNAQLFRLLCFFFQVLELDAFQNFDIYIPLVYTMRKFAKKSFCCKQFGLIWSIGFIMPFLYWRWLYCLIKLHTRFSQKLYTLLTPNTALWMAVNKFNNQKLLVLAAYLSLIEDSTNHYVLRILFVQPGWSTKDCMTGIYFIVFWI